MQFLGSERIHTSHLVPALVALSLTILLTGCSGEEAGTSSAPSPQTPATPDAPRESDARKKEPAVTPMEAVDAYIQEKKESNEISTSAPAWRTKLPRFPEVTFDKGTTYFWELQTNKGHIKIRFLSDTAPDHVANFIYLTKLGFFDGLRFHRVITGFMAQGGCPLGTGGGNPGYRFAGEFDPSVKHDKRGLLSMANSGPNTDGSQFFITFAPAPRLDGKHTIFGEMVDGEATLMQLEELGSRIGRTAAPISIERATISVE